MPFTFAHIGFILPFKKWTKSFSITGLVFGSITPDYDILFRFTKIRFHVFQYDIKTILFLIFPISVLSAILFHVVCRNILISNLPNIISNNYMKYREFNFLIYIKTHYFRFTISILFAILLHLLLDYFCHILDASLVRDFFYKKTQNIILSKLGFMIGIYFLPVVFSLIGGLLVYNHFKNELIYLTINLKNKSKILFWILIVFFTLFFSNLKLMLTEIEYNFYLDYFVISITSSFIFSVYLTCFLYYLTELLLNKAQNNV